MSLGRLRIKLRTCFFLKTFFPKMYFHSEGSWSRHAPGGRRGSHCVVTLMGRCDFEACAMVVLLEDGSLRVRCVDATIASDTMPQGRGSLDGRRACCLAEATCNHMCRATGSCWRRCGTKSQGWSQLVGRAVPRRWLLTGNRDAPIKDQTVQVRAAQQRPCGRVSWKRIHLTLNGPKHG